MVEAEPRRTHPRRPGPLNPATPGARRATAGPRAAEREPDISTLLIGFWSTDRATLTITASHQVADGDQSAIDALNRRAFANGAHWACEFHVDEHRRAVQRAYDEYARDDDAVVEDDVEGCTPDPY
ncbi:hypothetical protein [Streptomyces sp. NPDC092903]|uniref:hypothetical protein n=1 Tax=Streptomyces sp. NPDC092903 TaxID=3366017 RepID=UPI0037FE3C74